MKFALLVRRLCLSSVALGCGAFVPASLRAVSADCIQVNSTIKQVLAQGQAEQAQRLALDALAVAKNRLEPVCAGLLLNAAASSSLLTGKLGDARTLAERSVTYFRQGLPADDPVLLRPLHLLANVYLVQGLTGKAHEVLRRMEAIRMTSPRDRALFREVSATVLQHDGKLREAEMSYLAALEAISEAGDEMSADGAAVQRNLALLYIREQRYPEASKAVDAALATLQRAKDAVPLDLLQLLNIRATASARQGRWSDAETDLRGAISIARGQPGLDAVELEPLVTNYARVLSKLHRKEARFVEAWSAKLHSQTADFRQTVDVVELARTREAGRQRFEYRR